MEFFFDVSALRGCTVKERPKGGFPGSCMHLLSDRHSARMMINEIVLFTITFGLHSKANARDCTTIRGVSGLLEIHLQTAARESDKLALRGRRYEGEGFEEEDVPQDPEMQD